MKIRVADLKPNPFRNIEHYPISRDKVEMLKQSIEQTTFWDNILCRKHNGEYQIAYGHHRLVALREFGITEVDIPVRGLSDARMLQVMAQENREEYGTTPAVINETVRAARDFLRENPEEATGSGQPVPKSDWPGQATIAKFLDWPVMRVKRALADIHAIEREDVDEEAIREMPTQEHAASFRKSMKRASGWTGGKKISKESQLRIAEESKKEHETAGEDGSARRTELKVEAEYHKQFSDIKPDRELVEQTITNERILKLTRRLESDAEELMAVKSMDYIPPSLQAGLANAIKDIVRAIEEITNG